MAASASSRLLFGDRVPGITDVHGRPAVRSGTGGWRSSLFIIGVEVAERLAYYGASSNLITYLTDYLNQNTATAAKNVNIWSGVASLLPLLGAFVADSYLGRYRTIIISSLIYLLGLILLTLSAAVPSLQPNGCYKTEPRALAKCHGSSTFQVAFFFFSLYLIALGQGGHKPCVQSFGADQFNEDDPTERRGKASFFNWWYMGICGGSLLAVSVVMYVQDNMGWGLGFGIPAVAMAMGLGAFLWGRTSYRLSVPGGSPFIKIVQVIVAAARKRNVPWPQSVKWEEDEEDEEKLLLWSSEVYELRTNRTLPHTKQFRWLDKAAIRDIVLGKEKDWSMPNRWRVCTVTQVEEVKLLLRLVPIWTCCLLYAVVFAQPLTFFTKQGTMMDRRVGSRGFEIPPAAMQTFTSISSVSFVPIYDLVIVPIARKLSSKDSGKGITMLQRIGIGISLSILTMVVAALVESKRLEIARELGLIDVPGAVVPMSCLWLIPQYMLFGVSEVFTIVGLQEFFYDQMPDALRSLGAALYLSVIGIGSLLSSILISLIERASIAGGESWFSDNLNRAHLDYFYWLLALLTTFSLCLFVFFANHHIYKRVNPSI